MNKKIVIIFLLILTLFMTFSFKTAAFSEKRADFSINYNNLEIPLQKFSIFVLPGEEIKLEIAEEDRNKNYQIEIVDKIFESSRSFTWNAHQESGFYPVKIRQKNNNSSSAEIKINVFVLYPKSEKNGAYLDGFRIGNYSQVPVDKKEHYSKPKGFLKIDESNIDKNLSPNFKLKQFLTNQSTELPQYIAIQESMLLKLELFLKEVNKAGYYAETFGIVSMYRTPYFNKKIGNNSNFSRHLFGDAVDIYIDNSGDDWMDDLNGDGEVNIEDANILYQLAVEFDQKEEYSHLKGGVSSYHSNGYRGPFIHIDTRGYHVSW